MDSKAPGKFTEEEERIFELHAQFCRIFTDPKRLQILWCLGKNEKSVGDIALTLDLPLSNVSQHLRVMRDHDAIVARRSGRNVFYKISEPKFMKGATLIREGLVELMNRKSRIWGKNEDEC